MRKVRFHSHEVVTLWFNNRFCLNLWRKYTLKCLFVPLKSWLLLSIKNICTFSAVIGMYQNVGNCTFSPSSGIKHYQQEHLQQKEKHKQIKIKSFRSGEGWNSSVDTPQEQVYGFFSLLCWIYIARDTPTAIYSVLLISNLVKVSTEKFNFLCKYYNLQHTKLFFPVLIAFNAMF